MDETTDSGTHDEAASKTICRTCPVRPECPAYAVNPVKMKASGRTAPHTRTPPVPNDAGTGGYARGN
ncbi:WhiB family transcriptional regulator [Rhodococcus jostii]|uniref:WhiB family transcriptional regulator n=1 Tax=Rhodococcus jostii TaxID=132919 RepID=UPI003C6DFED9